MASNLEKYKNDIDRLIDKGQKLLDALESDKGFADFRNQYEEWYTEALALIKIVLPDRVDDFKRYYDSKDADSIRNRISGSRTGPFYEIGNGAKLLFANQLGILKGARRRFESSLFDIKQVLQADLFDSELDAARELNEKGFARGAGAIAGVVLESHLAKVCENHKLKMKKKNPTINDFNQLLKDNDVIDVKDWRFIQHLADLRNLCDHKKGKEPTQDDVDELIQGVEKIIKTVF